VYSDKGIRELLGEGVLAFGGLPTDFLIALQQAFLHDFCRFERTSAAAAGISVIMLTVFPLASPLSTAVKA
jgi:hypothetical protein